VLRRLHDDEIGSLEEAQRTAPEHKQAHLARTRPLNALGILVMAGAFLDRPVEPVRTLGFLVSRADAEEYAQAQPARANLLA
jgi:uncharacterized protein YciI